jgi:hypothetical protein
LTSRAFEFKPNDDADDAFAHLSANDAAHDDDEREMSRLTERQQLARAMAESSAMTPALATTRDAKGRATTRDATSDGTPRTPAPRATTTTRGTMDSSSTSTTRGKRRSRVEKELASLAPWAWDPLVGRHAPGPSALRDFSEVVADGVAARVANAIGSGQKIEMKTFDRTLALRGDDAREGGGGANARTKPREKTTREKETKRASATTVTKTTGTKSRERSSKAAAVTPIVLSKTLDDVAATPTEKKPTRTSARTTRGSNSVQTTAIEVVDVAEKENKPIARKKAIEQREIGARVKRSGAGVLRDSNGAAAKKEATPTEVAPAAKKRKTPPAQSVAKDTKTVVKAFQTPAATKKRAIAPVEEKTPSREDLALRKLTVARKQRMEAQLELVLAKTYVRAIKRPIIPQAKPSQRLLDAYRAFSLACAANREAPPKPAARPRTLEFGAALARGVDTLRAEDESVAAGVN